MDTVEGLEEYLAGTVDMDLDEYVKTGKIELSSKKNEALPNVVRSSSSNSTTPTTANASTSTTSHNSNTNATNSTTNSNSNPFLNQNTGNGENFVSFFFFDSCFAL
jgi:hypothetical protein